MTISEVNVKKLWGKAAGRCAFPNCNLDCLPMLNALNVSVIGEMAHQIAQQENGPRGIEGGGSDSYENLILLCPTHHKFIDKAPKGTYSVSQIQEWKTLHEEHISAILDTPNCRTRFELNNLVRELLQENYSCWKIYGPESEEAQKNPQSSMAKIWAYRKLSIVVPNNKKIEKIIKTHKKYFTSQEYILCSSFFEHAAGFESNCIKPAEGVPRFTVGFSEIFND